MLKFQFVESLSADPAERAIAARVVAILNNPRLDSAQRERLVRQAQRELVDHQQRRDAATLPVADRNKPRKRVAAVDPIAARRWELGKSGASQRGLS